MSVTDLQEHKKPTNNTTVGKAILPIRKPAVIIFGPTAVGKTDLLRQFYGLDIEVISADSRQIYRELKIATAHPPKDILEKIPHHLIGNLHYNKEYSVSDFVQDCTALIDNIRSRGRHPLIVGGAAFYLYHLWKGLPKTPAVDAKIRTELQAECSAHGQAAMFAKLQGVDTHYAQTIDANDTYRTLRALEVYTQTGYPLSSFNKFGKTKLQVDFLVIGLTRPRPVLYERINVRVDSMFAQGLVNEIHSLWKGGLNATYAAARTIGVQEFLQDEQVLEAWNTNRELSAEQYNKVKALIKRNSRRYAKRQMTFFSKFLDVRWYSFDDESKSSRDTALVYKKIVEVSKRFLEN